MLSFRTLYVDYIVLVVGLHCVLFVYFHLWSGEFQYSLRLKTYHPTLEVPTVTDTSVSPTSQVLAATMLVMF